MNEKNIKPKLVKKTIYISQNESDTMDEICEKRGRKFAGESRRAIQSHIEIYQRQKSN